MEEILNQIQKSIKLLSSHPEFLNWLDNENIESGGWILINNSFVYRDVSTNKSSKYLTLKILDEGRIDAQLYIASDVRINNDFKFFSNKSNNSPIFTKLNEAINEEQSQLGSIIYFLIGQIDDSKIIEQSISNEKFNKIVWNPKETDLAKIQDSILIINDTNDEEAIWNKILFYFKQRGEVVPDGFREALGVSLDKLQDEATAYLNLPSSSTNLVDCITDAIVIVLKEQKEEYVSALSKYGEEHSVSTQPYNEVLRIAYNFASDATTFLKLIVSICDLKPIILWGTLFEHYQLSEAFRKLPWTRSEHKPSLKNYISIIADARNSAFHNLFPFRKSLSLNLPDSAFQNANITIFSEHGKKKNNRLDYLDKQLVDILLEFTRARNRKTSLRFWQQNIEVMDNTIKLFQSTSDFLKELFLFQYKHISQTNRN